MESELRVLEDLYLQIEKARVNFKKSPKDRLTVNYIEARLETLEKQFSSFTNKHEILISNYEANDLYETSYIEEDVFQNASDLYLDYKVELKNVLSNIKPDDSVSSNYSPKTCDYNINVKLPEIKIPTFNGKYLEWSSFRDMFTSLIHKNKNLDEVQKLHYLKSQVSGEAEQLIRHLPVTGANYMKCWEILTNRFNNKRFLSNCILKRLFSQRNMMYESSSALKELLDTTSECLHELENLGVDVKSWDVIIIYVVSLKLDVESRKQWELQVSKSSDDLPSLVELKGFLENRFRALEFVEPKYKFASKPMNFNNTKVMHTVSNVICPICSESHRISNCREFANSDVEKRRKTIESMRLCFNCLGSNHSAKVCRVPIKCRVCKRKHHSLLHPKASEHDDVGVAEKATGSTNVHIATTSKSEVPKTAAHFSSGIMHSQVLLATAVVKAETNDGSLQLLRALLDQGSQGSFITESAVQLLKLKKIKSKSIISGLGSSHSGITSNYVVKVNIQSLHDPSFIIQVEAHVLKKLTSVLPERKCNTIDWPELEQIQLADEEFYTPNKINILLGAEVYCRILKNGLLKSPNGYLIAQSTYFGWILSGPVNTEENTSIISHNIVSMQTTVDENELLKKFWEMESETQLNSENILSPEEKACEDHFYKTVQRDNSGRYVVSLPFKNNDPLCKYGNSKQIAITRLRGLERSFAKNEALKRRYSEVINEYINLGHMERVPKNEINKIGAVYLPHHAVIKEERSTTKTRIVFDASCKGSNGVSLNDTLMVGPTLQPTLRCIIIKWRQHPICLAADIVKMYRQVKVSGEDTDYQRIVWRENSNDEIEDYRMLRVTFGISSAPYLAVKALQQTACDDGGMYPLAAKRILNEFYVDDLMTGCESEGEAIELYNELNELVEKGGFCLQKWTSNKDHMLWKLKERFGGNLEIKTDEITKILGLTWNRTADEFTFSVSLIPSTGSETKRSVISKISLLYDPLGWLSPVIVMSKIFIQKLWLAGLDWDTKLSIDLLSDWNEFYEQLKSLEQLRIPRWIRKEKNNLDLSLHGFCDASNSAYAAVIYCRVVDCNGKIYSHLITAKTKVAPIKQLSVPRLELCGATLLAKLLAEVGCILEIPKSNWIAWTDSTVVLAWLNDHPSRWKTFVANRTSEILGLLDSSQWSHVQSHDNPADCASRGMLPKDFIKNESWLSGPSWLRNKVINYTKPEDIKCITKLERKTVKVYSSILENDVETNEIWSQFSNFRKLVRVIAYCRRMLRLKLPVDERQQLTPYLTASEIRNATNCCIRMCQNQNFGKEIHDIQTKNCVNKGSKLISLNPFLDNEYLLKVGGRLQMSKLSENSKHPIILPSNSHFTKLVIAEAHNKTLHGGQQLMLHFLRSKYWILNAKNLVKNYIRRCVTCIRYAAKTTSQLMGQLPTCRVTPSKPFLHSGVDYAGPVNIKVSKGRGHRSHKGYICLFVCLATRAVHIEVVTDMTSQGFLAAFKRFVARRGHCSVLWSDNGTNFVGASKELKKIFANERALTNSEVATALANNQTDWHFIPPHAPNFGGIWEAGIKSTKFHLKRVIGDTILTYEELSTVLSQIEACLNSRPLSKATSDSSDPVPLTPSHFLVGQPLVVIPDCNYEYKPLGNLRRWQLTQRLLQNFWRRWSNEYLTQFFQRYKWTEHSVEPKIGDVVIIKEDNLPPAQWLYGIVIQLHPGKDSITRVVTLRCKGSLIRRPTSKLCFLPTTE
jgi:hypothetical protein